jgi:hypothetical protein
MWTSKITSFYFFILASNLYKQYVLQGSDMNYDQSNYNRE